MVDTRGAVRLGMPSNERPTMNELNRYLTEYCKLWKSIGYKLGLEDAVLDMIQSDCLAHRERFAAVLQKWLELDARATWNMLELAITNARREELSLEALPEMPVQPLNGEQKDGDKSRERKFTAFQEQKSISSDLTSVHFSTFVMTVRTMLEKCADKLGSCKEICCNLTIGNSDILLFSDEQLDKINKCLSFQQLFTILRRYWSWKEYSILKTIITVCESDEAEAELNKFEKIMGSYYGMKLISESYSPTELAEFPENYVKLCITVDKPYKSLTLQDFCELRTFIFEHLEVKKYIALPFIKFLFSSLHLEWYIPVQAVSHVIKMVHLNKRAFIQKSISLIKIGDRSILDIQDDSLHTDSKLTRTDQVFSSSYLIIKEHSHMLCASCNQVYKNPKYLPCYHSYCEGCLEKMQEHSKIICPTCKIETMVPNGGVKGLPNNYYMHHLVNKFILNNELENEIEQKCQDCNEDYTVIVLCTDCKLFLCHFCKEAHRYSKSCGSHNLIPLTELRSNKDLIQSKSKFPTCQEHDLELEYYCETCEKLVCAQCTGEHKDHNYDVVKKFANKYQSELNKMTASIELMAEDLSKLFDSINFIKEAIRQQGNEISEEIDLYYDEVFQRLKKQKEEIKQRVSNTVFQKEKALSEQLEEAIHTEADVINIQRIRESLQVSSDQEVLSAKNELVCSLERLKETFRNLGREPIESANIKVTPFNKPLPEVVKHCATIDSLLFEVKHFNSFVQRGQKAMLELITKDHKGNYYPRGGCEVTVEVESSMEGIITAQVIDYKDGTYMICCAAEQVGEIELSVFVNGYETEDSPFTIVVKENTFKPNKIITSHDDSFGQLRGIACSNNGMWAVADRNKNCVHLFNSQDNLIKRVGCQGDKNEQFKYPCDVAFDDNNNLYVTDSYNHRVQKFDTYGNFLLQFGNEGSGKGQLSCPIGVTTNQDRVYVADRDNNRISVFQNDGEFHSIIGHQHLSRHFDVTINVNSEILVADWRHHCIYFFTLEGHFIKNMTLRKETGNLQLKDPCSITTDSNGFILLADTNFNNHCISVFDKIGNCIYSFGSKGSNDDQFKFPRGIAVSPNNNIYISDTGNRRVQIFPG